MIYHVTSTKDFRRQYKKLVQSGNKRALEELDDVVSRLTAEKFYCGSIEITL
jgi:hypothetical protein